MFKIDPVSKIITINRGDTVEFPVYVNTMGNMWAPIKTELDDGDTLYFAIMEPNTKFEQAIVKKIFNKYSIRDTEGDLLIKLDPIDTLYLRPGKYYYSIKRKRVDVMTFHVERVDTIIPNTPFYIVD